MRTLYLCVAALMLPLTTFAAEPPELLEMRVLHLRPASDIAMNYSVVCDRRAYALVATLSPSDRRATSITTQVVEGAHERKADLTHTELGQLMTDRAGFGELGFGCGGAGLYLRYLGATRANDKAPAVVQDALFLVSPDGAVSRVPPDGVTLTPPR